MGEVVEAEVGVEGVEQVHFTVELLRTDFGPTKPPSKAGVDGDNCFGGDTSGEPSVVSSGGENDAVPTTTIFFGVFLRSVTLVERSSSESGEMAPKGGNGAELKSELSSCFEGEQLAPMAGDLVTAPVITGGTPEEAEEEEEELDDPEEAAEEDS
ncbi:hypothetical protein TYRP_003754 [Tyrophagus putrescentiae]|nr:hypothetical protein TYRP_003754 [Tyrophagus putrescentiae]